MMKIKALMDYYDKQLNMKLVKSGDEYEVSDERGRELISKGFAAEVKRGGKGSWQSSMESPTGAE